MNSFFLSFTASSWKVRHSHKMIVHLGTHSSMLAASHFAKISDNRNTGRGGFVPFKKNKLKTATVGIKMQILFSIPIIKMLHG